MGRLMAIDYGRKRIGIAVSDPSKIIANGLDTVSPSDIFKFLEEYFKKEDVECVVVGHPTRLNGEDSESMKYITPFISGFKKRFPNMKMVMFDERFTSVLANRTILESGIGKKERRNNKKLVDRVSATIILQDYMESLRMGGAL